jgi:hypothetical protein
MKQTTDIQQIQIIFYYEIGWSVKKISQYLKLNQNTVTL